MANKPSDEMYYMYKKASGPKATKSSKSPRSPKSSKWAAKKEALLKAAQRMNK